MSDTIIIYIKFLNNKILDIKDNATCLVNSEYLKLNIGDNIYEIIKKMKPCKNDLIKFNDLLSKFKLINNKYYLLNFKRKINNICSKSINENSNIYFDKKTNDVSNDESNDESNNESKFINEYSYTFLNNDNFINLNIVNLDIDININKYTLNLISFTDYNIIEFKINSNNFNSYLNHEIVNPINVINLSTKCIENNIIKLENDFKNKKKYIHNINNLNNIIQKESIWTKKLIDIFSNNKFNNNRLYKNEDNIKSLIKFINTYLLNNKFTNELNLKLKIFSINYFDLISLNLNHIQIILDNAFKNIFGYIDTNFNNFIDNNFDNFSNNINNVKNKLSTNNIFFSLQKNFEDNNYKLVIQSNFKKENKNNKYQKGIGFKLINDLCKKNNLNWNLIDNKFNVEFIVYIPIIHSNLNINNSKIKNDFNLDKEIKNNILYKNKNNDIKKKKINKRKLSLSLL